MDANGRSVLAVAALTLAAVPAPARDAGRAIRIEHETIGCVVAGQYPRLEARIVPADAVGRARAYFRSEGASEWYYVEMRAEAGVWAGVLPKPKPSLRGLSYYVEVTGAAFESSRTAEHGSRVVGRSIECGPGLLVAAVSAVGPALVVGPAGAVTAAPGFIGLTPVASGAGAGAGAGAAAASGGGMSGTTIGLLAGGVAVAGGAAAVAAGSSGGSGGSSASTAGGGASGGGGSGSGGTTRAPQSVTLGLSANCSLNVAAVYAGDTVTVVRGTCDWSSQPEAQAALAGQTATLTVDGAPLGPVRVKGPYVETNGAICAAAEADWKALAGAHVAAGKWSWPSSPVHTCALTVAP